MMVKADQKQIVGIVKERNRYRKLLEECVKAFNMIPNTVINTPDHSDTYQLVSAIEKILNKYK